MNWEHILKSMDLLKHKIHILKIWWLRWREICLLKKQRMLLKIKICIFKK